MSPQIRWIVLALAVVGIGLSAEALWVHYRLLTDPSYASPCDISATLNCSAVYRSQYGSVAGVPVAIGGLVWFGLVASIVAFARTERPESTAADYVRGLSIVGLATIAYFAYVSYFVLGIGCVLCIGTYACVLAIGALSMFGTSGSIGRVFANLGSDIASLPSRPAGFALGVLILGSAAWAAIAFPTEQSVAAQAVEMANTGTANIAGDFRSKFTAAWNQQPRVDLGIPADGAAVVVAKFNDFECPVCRQAEVMYAPVIKRFEATNPGAVKYVYKDYPLNASCNAHMQQTGPDHVGSCYAAAAGRAARARGKFDDFTTWMWANQNTSPEAVRENTMRILGITGPEFDKAYTEYLPAIRQDVADGFALNIRGTPTYFINGVRMPEALMPIESFTLAIEIELSKHQPATK
jgi:uncharacterized membrane protein/protein-disulfide isomerase